jgi:hypothetical protein
MSYVTSWGQVWGAVLQEMSIRSGPVFHPHLLYKGRGVTSWWKITGSKENQQKCNLAHYYSGVLADVDNYGTGLLEHPRQQFWCFLPLEIGGEIPFRSTRGGTGTIHRGQSR